jgi:hypothetical protein
MLASIPHLQLISRDLQKSKMMLFSSFENVLRLDVIQTGLSIARCVIKLLLSNTAKPN